MRTRTRMLTAVVLAGALAGACAGKSSASKDGGTHDISCSDPALGCYPPSCTNLPQSDGGTLTVLAVSRLDLGDTNSSGQPDPNAWKSLGFDLDGLDSTPGDANHCKLYPGANPGVKTDGNAGIDNSFGENVLPLLASVASDFSQEVNDSINAGRSTELIQIDNLTDYSQAEITGAVYTGADKGSPAAFDGSDVWPPTYESLVGGNPDKPEATFRDSEVCNSTLVTAGGMALRVKLDFSGGALWLPISRARIMAPVHGTGTSASATHGIIAGVIDTEAFVTEINRWLGLLDQSACDPSTLASIDEQLREASDIMLDGSNGDRSKSCDAISIGLGFDAAGVRLGAPAPPAPPPPNACAP